MQIQLSDLLVMTKDLMPSVLKAWVPPQAPHQDPQSEILEVCSSVVEPLPTKCEASISIPSTARKAKPCQSEFGGE